MKKDTTKRNANTKISTYKIAAGAAVAAIAGQQAEAGVVYSGVQDLAVVQGFSQSLNLDGDVYEDIILKNYSFFGGPYQGATVNTYPGKIVGFNPGGNNNYASALAAGDVIDSTTLGPSFVGSLAYGIFNPNAQFNSVTDAFIGFGFPIAGSTGLHYGWVRVSINNAAGEFTIHDWAYDDISEATILAGDTGPEGTPGDFNDDGVVDAADYTVFRDNLGTNFDLAGNGDEEGPSAGVVDQADYDLWAASYGNGVVPSATASAVPEPGTLGLLAAGALGILSLRNKRGSK